MAKSAVKSFVAPVRFHHVWAEVVDHAQPFDVSRIHVGHKFIGVVCSSCKKSLSD